MNSQLKQLYHQDLNLWREKIVTAIQNRKLENMDWDNLIEEINDMTASERRALRSYIKRLIEHILKLKYWRATPRRRKAQGNARDENEREYNRRGWEKEVVNFREEVKSILEESPSLNSYLEQNYFDWYAKSVKAMKREFSIPDNNLVDLNLIMTDDYFA